MRFYAFILDEQWKVQNRQKWNMSVLHLQSFTELMRHIEGADGATCDVTMGELVNPESEGNYGNMKGSGMILFYMGKLDQLDAGEK